MEGSAAPRLPSVRRLLLSRVVGIFLVAFAAVLALLAVAARRISATLGRDTDGLAGESECIGSLELDRATRSKSMFLANVREK